MTWADEAACRGMPVEMWVVDADRKRNSRAMLDRLDQCRLVCSRCPVSEPCLAEAMTLPSEDTSIRAGMAPWERRRLVRGPAHGHGTRTGYIRHRDNGEEPCAECRAANNAYQADWHRYGGRRRSAVMQ